MEAFNNLPLSELGERLFRSKKKLSRLGQLLVVFDPEIDATVLECLIKLRNKKFVLTFWDNGGFCQHLQLTSGKQSGKKLYLNNGWIPFIDVENAMDKIYRSFQLFPVFEVTGKLDQPAGIREFGETIDAMWGI